MLLNWSHSLLICIRRMAPIYQSFEILDQNTKSLPGRTQCDIWYTDGSISKVEAGACICNFKRHIALLYPLGSLISNHDTAFQSKILVCSIVITKGELTFVVALKVWFPLEKQSLSWWSQSISQWGT